MQVLIALVLVLAIVILLAVLAGIIAVAFGRGERFAWPGAPSRTLTVQGFGKASISPDEAHIFAGIHTVAPTAKESSTQAAQTMANALAALKSHGVEEKRIQTGRFSLAPEYQYPPDAPAQLIGYAVTNMVSATVTDLDDLGALLDDLIEAGGDQVRIDGIQFASSDPTAAQEQAREKALADARRQAGEIAQAMGVALGRPISINRVEPMALPRPHAMMRAMTPAGGAAPQTPIEAGEMEVRVLMEVVYAIR
jgi:uncharacterized protein YggE